MLEEEATVVATSGEDARISIIPASSCQSCSAKSACGTSLLASFFAKRDRTFVVRNSIGATVGQRVVVGLNEHVLQRASLLVYMLPLLGLILGGILGSQLAGGHISVSEELLSIGAGLLGMVLMFLLVRKLVHQDSGKERYQAKILRIINTPVVKIVERT